ncbi:MAG TPA: SGNH/GDSL hydrolase family protein, partial [Acidimicrobiales bacterium]
TDVAVGVPGFANVGCPITRGGSFRLNFSDDHSGKVFDAANGCDWTQKLPTLVAQSHPDLALFSGGVMDTVPRKLAVLGPGWHTIDEPAFQDAMRSEYEAAVDAVVGASPSTKVVLLTVSPDWKRGNATHAERVDLINHVIEQVAADRPGVTEIVDLKGWIDGTGERQRLCPDGLHLMPATTGKEVFERFLGPRLAQVLSGAVLARH